MIVAEVLVGKRVRLRPMEECDLPLLVGWFNDPDVRQWHHRSERPADTLDSERDRHQRYRDDPTMVRWCIDTVEGRPVGSAGLLGIDPVHARAELEISIGDRDCWGQGYGTDAIRCVLRYAFEELGLRRVWLITDADNGRGIRCYEKCGFQREALLRGHRLRYGRPLDMLAMGVLREEFALHGLEDRD